MFVFSIQVHGGQVYPHTLYNHRHKRGVILTMTDHFIPTVILLEIWLFWSLSVLAPSRHQTSFSLVDIIDVLLYSQLSIWLLF